MGALGKDTSDDVDSTFFGLRGQIEQTCDVAAETRMYAAHASAGHAVSDYINACP